MASTFHYHTIKTSWGIVVWLTCEATVYDAADASSHLAINDQLYLICPEYPELNIRLSDEEIGYLRLGLSLVSDQIRGAAPDECVVVTVLRVDLVLTDYQPEGLACAIMGWTAEHFGFTPPPIPISYDPQRNRYDFQFA